MSGLLPPMNEAHSGAFIVYPSRRGLTAALPPKPPPAALTPMYGTPIGSERVVKKGTRLVLKGRPADAAQRLFVSPFNGLGCAIFL